MAKSSTERMRELRARQKRDEKSAASKLAPTTYVETFSNFLEKTGRSGLGVYHLKLGADWWDFSTDSGIKPATEDELDDEEMKNASNSLGKAELILSILEDMVPTLAENINDYKRKEIRARMKELENSDLSDPATRKKALADMVTFQKMLDQLDKQARWTFPQWQATGL
jgi:hypothetical protein